MLQKPAKATARQLLAENIRMTRAMLGLSQMKFALECGLDRTYVGALERGGASAGLDVLDQLASCLAVPVNTLLLPPDEAQPVLYAAYRKRKPFPQ